MAGSLHAVIAGGGRVGQNAATMLADYGHDVTIVDADPERCADLSDEYLAMVIEGDATDPEILAQATTDRTDVVGALTGNTDTNVTICSTAETVVPEARRVLRVDRDPDESHAAVADVTVYPEMAGARIAAAEMLGSDVAAVAAVTGSLDILRVLVTEDAPAAGRTLSEISLPHGVLVISADADGGVVGPDTRLDPGERYVVAVEPDVADEVLNLLQG
jgi:trk system potassium uptake protein TrkA